MFREQTHPGGFVTLHSPQLDAVGVPHAFTTAVNGLHIGTAAHLTPVLSAMSLSSRRVVMTRQVHGCRVTTNDSREAEADAHVTADATELVAVRTADCVPLLLSTGDGNQVAAVHAGWRGLLAGVIGEAVRHFDPSDTVAAVGPCIGVGHYEVGDEVAARFGHGVLREPGRRAHLDLRAVALEQLLVAGVPAERIDVASDCTFADAERFHSYRRQGKGCGHMAAFVGPVG